MTRQKPNPEAYEDYEGLLNRLGERIVDGDVRDGRKELNQLVSVFDERVDVEITYVNVHISIIYCGAGIF